MLKTKYDQEELRNAAEQVLMDNIVMVEDFPKVGIRYLDFYRTFDVNPTVRTAVIDCFVGRYGSLSLDGIAAIGTGGFTFGAVVSQALNLPMFPVRKFSDTVYNAYRCKVGMVYAEREVSFSKDIDVKGKNLALLDDTLATGGTFSGALDVLSQAGANIVEIGAVFETTSKRGRENLSHPSIFTVVQRENY